MLIKPVDQLLALLRVEVNHDITTKNHIENRHLFEITSDQVELRELNLFSNVG